MPTAKGSEPKSEPIKTTGEIFEDGKIIELVRSGTNPKLLRLLFWDGNTATIGERVCHDNRIYEPAAVESTILCALMLPTKSATCGPAKSLLTDICTMVKKYSGFPDDFATIIGRFVLASWVVEAMNSPQLSIIGPYTRGGTQLFRLLSSLCRRSVLLTEVDVHGVQSLPMQLRLTLLIRQPDVSPRLERLLSAMRKRNEFVPQNGRLLDLHCAVATYSDSRRCRIEGALPCIEIPVRASIREVPVLSDSSQQRIAEMFQPRLLGYRLEYYHRIYTSDFDIPDLTPPIRELARTLGACTPCDVKLEAETIQFLRAQDAEIRSESWTDPDNLIIEAVLGFVHESKMECAYVLEIAKAVETILAGRGEFRNVDPREVGPRLRFLGLMTEPRNSKGIRLQFTQALCRRIHDLARDYDVPSIRRLKKGCILCV